MKRIKKILLRDSQRAKVYRAETDLYGCLDPEPEMPLAACQALANRVMAYCKERAHVAICDGRGKRRAHANCWAITLPRWARRRLWVLHEAAHVVTHRIAMRRQKPIQGHGREFARLYIKLVRHFIGRTEASLLKQSFKENRVRYTNTKEGPK